MQHGMNKINILILIVFLNSCKGSKLLYSGVNATHIYTYYINDSINFSVKLAGDIKKYENLKELNQKLRLYKIKKFKTNVIDFFKSDNEPFYDLFLLKFDDNKQLSSFLNQSNFRNITNNKDGIEILDSSKNVFGKVLLNNKSPLLLIVYSNDKAYFNLMVEEFSDVFKTMEYSDEYRSILPSPFEIANSNSVNPKDGLINYLKPIISLLKYQDIYTYNDFSYVQAVCTYSCRISNYKVFDNYFDIYNKMVFYDSVETNKFKTNESAKKEIIKIASTSNLVMFNENHFDIRHRKLVKFLLKDFYDLGYRYLALESLFENKQLLNNRGYPVQKSGFYTREPEMSDLIRVAIEMGYNVFGYDSFGQNERELNQASNIFNNSFVIDSSAKVLVLGGHDHIFEEKSQNKVWMAYYLKNKYGINPVTFSQTAVQSNNKFWLGIIKNDSISKQPVDYLLSNNISDDNFPEYKPYQINIQLPISKYKNDLILSIFLSSEIKNNNKPIPIKNIIIPYKDTSVICRLKKGNYIYFIKQINGNTLMQKEFINK